MISRIADAKADASSCTSPRGNPVMAICNSTMLGTPTTFNLAAAIQTLAGTNTTAILKVNDQADDYNNSGDNISAYPNAGPASSKVAWDDVTDPND